MSIENIPARKTKRGLVPKALLWVFPVFIVCLAIPGAVMVALYDRMGLRGLDLLNHDPVNLVAQLLPAGLVLFLIVAGFITAYVLLPRWLRTVTLKGSK